MTEPERRLNVLPDRRRVPRGGRRKNDLAGRHPTVLVADSYEDARSPIARFLERFGFQVLQAATAQEAADLLRRHHPPIILSGLRGADASHFYELMPPKIAATATILIVMLSGSDDPVPAQATTVLSKPFSLPPMLDTLRRELRAAEGVLDGS